MLMGLRKRWTSDQVFVIVQRLQLLPAPVSLLRLTASNGICTSRIIHRLTTTSTSFLSSQPFWFNQTLDHFSPCVLAKKFGAVVVTLEHRYYGKSSPFKSLTTENLKYRSSNQALFDLAVSVRCGKIVF